MGNDSFFQRLMTIVCDEKKMIEEIINPQANLLAKYNYQNLIGKNISEIENISRQENNKSLEIIEENIKKTEQNGRCFFKYTVEIKDKEKVDAVCMSEQHDNGYIFVNIICTEQSNIKDEVQVFKNYILDSLSYGSSIGLSVSYVNAKQKKYYLIFNDAIKKMYSCDNVRLSQYWNEREESQTDRITLENGSYTFDIRSFNEDGTTNKWLIINKRIIKCNSDGNFIVTTTTDATNLSNKYSYNSESNLEVTRTNSKENLLSKKNEKPDITRGNSDLIKTSDVNILKKLHESVTKNKLFLDNIGTGLAYIDKDYNIVWKNSTFNEIHNIKIPDNELVDNKCYSSIYNRDTPCKNCIVGKVLKSGKNKIISNYRNSHDVFNIIGLPVKDKEENVIGIVLKIEKITNEYNAKKESESISRMLQNIIDNLPLGLYIKDIDDDFKYLIVNKTVCQLSNFKPEDCIGKTDYDILTKKYADEFRKDDEDIVKLYSKTKLPVIKFKNISFGNSEKILKTINIVYKHDKKNILISIAHNETEREKIIKELSIAKSRAEEADKLKSAFLANMSHEIRTPLNAIVGFSEIVAQNDNKEENAEYIKIIQFNNKLLLRLINDILDLSKLDAGVIKLENKEFDLAGLDNRFKAFYENNILNSEVEFIAELPYSKCIVNLDEQRFMQVICNFITNAIKYTSRGYIKFGYHYENNGIKVYVKDTGIGIPKAVQNKIFTRFGKANENVQGNGLGLNICKAIVDMQKGKIGFESDENRGSTFWAWFPTKADLELKENSFNSCLVSNNKENNIRINDNVKSKEVKKNIRILVAEDNDSNFLLLNTLLNDYDLTRVMNGKEAVEKTKKSSFDLIIMDMKMPVMGGLEATKMIREFNDKVMIVALTASVFSSDMKAEREAGCNEIITKPITMKGRECLFEIINNL